MAINGYAGRPLRVAHVTQALDMGGLEKLLVEFARHADRRHFTLHFFSLSSAGLLADEIRSCGWPVTALNMAEGFRPRLFWQLARLFRRWQIDVVHSHDERPHIYGAIAGRLAGVSRVIHTRHRGKNLAVSSRQNLLLHVVSRLTDRFVCVSRDSARLASTQGICLRKACVIWNGIDLARFRVHDPNPEGPVVTVARMSPEKDIETLIRAIGLAAPLRLVVAGDGPCLPQLRQLVTQLGLDERVRFLGQVRDVPGLLSRASLFVLPSLTEGISLTLLEAMASSLAVVTTRVGGNPEVVADGETGLLVPPGNPAALVAALLRLNEDLDLRRRMGQAGRKRVEEHFEIGRMVAAYETLYRGRQPLAEWRVGSVSDRSAPVPHPPGSPLGKCLL
jgi:glycosyltransferase involved in cell wall biosynthesis